MRLHLRTYITLPWTLLAGAPGEGPAQVLMPSLPWSFWWGEPAPSPPDGHITLAYELATAATSALAVCGLVGLHPLFSHLCQHPERFSAFSAGFWTEGLPGGGLGSALL